MKEILVADLTKAYPNKLQETLARLETALDSLRLEPSHLILFGREDQVSARDHWSGTSWHLTSDEEAATAVENLLTRLAKSEISRPDLAHVLTFNPQVLTRAGGPPLVPGMRVAASHLASWQPKPHSHPAGAVAEPHPQSEAQATPPAMVNTEPPASDEWQSRSDLMEQAIRKAAYGPYSGIRWRVYAALEEQLAAGVGKTFRQLVWEALLAVKAAGTGNSSYDWQRVRDTLIKVLAEARVVLDEHGSPVPTGPAGRLVPVHSFAQDWRVKADAELAMSCIERLGDISEYDYPDLAGALYHSRAEEEEDRVAEVLAELIRQDRVEESREDGICYLRAKSSARPAEEVPYGAVERFPVLRK